MTALVGAVFGSSAAGVLSVCATDSHRASAWGAVRNNPIRIQLSAGVVLATFF